MVDDVDDDEDDDDVVAIAGSVDVCGGGTS